MNKQQLIAYFQELEAPDLLRFLDAAYEAMNTDQREAVFGEAIFMATPLPVDGPSLLEQVGQFHSDSVSGKYYAPFDINSKNFMHVPEKTKVWFERLGDLLTDAARLSQQDDHADAIACFRILYELVENMCCGDEIVFADEYGTWMIPVDETQIISAYLASLAATSSPKEYTAAALPLIRRDSCESFSNKTYAAAVRAASGAQKAHLKAEVERLQIRITSRSCT